MLLPNNGTISFWITEMVALAMGAGMAASGLASGVGSAIAGSTEASAAQKAAQQQYQAGQAAIGDIKQYSSQAQGYLSPFTNAGESAIPTLQALLGVGPNGSAGMTSTLENLPGYQFAYGQGQQANNASMAAQGLGLSGAQVRGATNYAEGNAQQAYSTYAQQLQSLLGLGEGAANSQANIASNTGAQIGNVAIGQGSALAAGTIGAGNANAGIATGVANSVGTLANAGGLYSYLTSPAGNGLLNTASGGIYSNNNNAWSGPGQ
jgi:hypothetical protein